MKDIAPNNPKCDICKHIPSSMEVEILHTEERLPKQVDELEIIGGHNADYGLGQIRKCPKCETYYLWFHDHDSESGVGYGYTDESIDRVTNGRALEAIEKNLSALKTWAMMAGKEAKDPDQHDAVRASATKRLNRYQEERNRLKQERDLLK